MTNEPGQGKETAAAQNHDPEAKVQNPGPATTVAEETKEPEAPVDAANLKSVTIRPVPRKKLRRLIKNTYDAFKDPTIKLYTWTGD